MDLIRKYWHILVGIVCVAALGTIYLRRDTEPAHLPTPERTPITAQAADAPPVQTIVEDMEDIVVHIAGEVNQPGVFTLPYGSRVNDVLALAGGATEYADLARVNLAALLQDAKQVIIPAIGSEVEAEVAQAAAAESGLININVADERDLQTLPGIGPARASTIIAHRDTHGPFSTIEELQNVSGIGPGILGSIRELITVN